MGEGPKPRNGLIDILRALGSLGIVWFHIGAPGHAVAYAALPMFITLSVILQPAQVDFRVFVQNRARRLLRPWVIWSGIYACIAVLRSWHHGLPLTTGFHFEMLLVGTVLPLWFLPFIFVCGVVFHLIETRLTVWGGKLSVLGFLILGLLMPAMALAGLWALPFPLAQWSFGIVPAVYGFAARLCRVVSRRLTLIFLVLSLSALIADQLPSAGPNAFAIWFGTGSVLIGSRVQIAFRPWMAVLGPISFLIYVVHPGMSLLAYYIPWGHDPLWSALVVIGLSSGFAFKAIRVGWDHILL